MKEFDILEVINTIGFNKTALLIIIIFSVTVGYKLVEKLFLKIYELINRKQLKEKEDENKRLEKELQDQKNLHLENEVEKVILMQQIIDKILENDNNRKGENEVILKKFDIIFEILMKKKFMGEEE